MTPFGALFRFFREKRGYSQAAVATQLSVDSKFISSLETGRRRPPMGDDLERLCKALGLEEGERIQLEKAALDSSSVIRLPRDTSPCARELVHLLVRSVNDLGTGQMRQIRDVIEGRQ